MLVGAKRLHCHSAREKPHRLRSVDLDHDVVVRGRARLPRSFATRGHGSFPCHHARAFGKDANLIYNNNTRVTAWRPVHDCAGRFLASTNPEAYNVRLLLVGEDSDG